MEYKEHPLLLKLKKKKKTERDLRERGRVDLVLAEKKRTRDRSTPITFN
jgi:hypothetical protein